MSSSSDAPSEWIVRIDDRGALGADVCAARDRGNDAAFGAAVRALEDAADDALLPPHIAFGKRVVGGKAGKPRAGAGAARRAIVRETRAQHEVAAVVFVIRR